MPILSVIIPIYNVEKYVRQCIKSVLNQGLESYELILVNDGSTDNSVGICNDFSQKYENVRVFNKENGGASSARNYGLRNATSDYVIFMDSDDWWNPDVNVNKIMEFVFEHPQTEMFLFTSYDYVEGSGYFQRNEHKNLENLDTMSVKGFYRSLLNNGNLEVAAYTKVFKRDFLLKNNLFFNTDLICEDNEWMIRVLRALKRVDIINQPLYIYRTGRTDSITNTIKMKNITDMLSIVNDSIKYYSYNDNDIKEQELCFASYLWFCALGLAYRLNKMELNEVKPLFKKTSSVCKYSNSKKTKLSNFVYRVFGFNLTVKILGLYLSKKRYESAKTKVFEQIGQFE